MMADIHGRFVRTLVPSQGKGYAVGVAYLFKSNIIFWSDTHTEKVGPQIKKNYAFTGQILFTHSAKMLLSFKQVYSTNFNGDEIKVVLDYSVRDVQNLAVDWINFKLYVLEDIVERIDACDFDGFNRVTLVAENLRSPRGLALDPTVGCVCGEQDFYYLLCVFNQTLIQCILH